MRILFDHCAPAPLIPFLPGHEVTEAYTLRWAEFRDGDLIGFAEQEGFDVLLTTDKSMFYQQNLKLRKIALVILETQHWAIVCRYVRRIAVAVAASQPGDVRWVHMPKF